MIIGNLAPLLLDHSNAWEAYLDTLPWLKGQRDLSSYNAFLRATSMGIPAEKAIPEVNRRYLAAGGSPSASKLKHQYNSAANYTKSAGASDGIYLPKTPTPNFNLQTLQRIAAKATGIDEPWLATKSPVAIESATAATFLDSLYQPGENVIVFTECKSKGQVVYEVGHPAELPSEGPEGVWFLTNPVDGIEHLNEDGKMSRRSKEAVTAWRYLVLECDHEEKYPGVNALWLAAMVQLPLKISAICTSGGKSIHALVRLDASTKEEWDAMRDKIKPILVPLGADPAAMTAVRLSRLPQTLRGKAPQRLLYLNPQPTEQPILKK